jgi:predicted  nucleic acid-binding Zn-ribbon protein
VNLQGEGSLAFEPHSAIDFATFENLATNRGTFEATLARLEADGLTAPASFRDLADAAEVERLSGPDGAGDATPLTVVLRVHGADPATTARWANAWAATAVEQVRSALLAGLEPAHERALATIDEREADLAEAESAFRAFQARDRDGAERRLQATSERLLALENQLDDLDRRIVGLEERRRVLAPAAGAEAGGIGQDDLALLEGTDRLDDEAAALFGAAADTSGAGSPLALLARHDLMSVTVALVDHRGERDDLAAAIVENEERLAALRDEVADLRAEELAVERSLSDARSGYEAVQRIEPLLAFVAELTPTNTRVLNAAQEPVQAEGPSVVTTSLVALVAGGLLATLAVFLREAVRDPTTSRPD